MAEIPGQGLQEKESHPGSIERLLGARAVGVWNVHFWIICALTAALGFFYYGVLSDFHDLYVVLFFYPLIYAAIIYRVRGVIFGGIILLGIILPHAILVSYNGYSLAISLLLAVFAITISGMGATLLNYLERQLEAFREIASLNQELSGSLGRLQKTQRQLIQSEKLNALGQLSADIAHEVNNPLSAILVYNKLLAKAIGEGTFEKEYALVTLSKTESAVNHCSKLVRSLLDFARQSEPALKPVALSGIIDQVISLVGHQAKVKNIEILVEGVSELPAVMADSGQLQQVFINLVVNAVQAMSGEGKITISGSVGERGRVKVTVRDTGCGIPLENMDQLFTPFFTTKGEGKGVGLGLSVSYGIIQRHGGNIEVQSEVGKGSTFTVSLPRAPDVPA